MAVAVPVALNPFVVTLSVALKPNATALSAKVFLPPNVCALEVTIPPLVPSAGVKLNTPEVMVAPLAVDDTPIDPIEVEDPPVEVEPSAIKYSVLVPFGVLKPAPV